ncbi:hypothetical protein GR157_07620 [Burkholderia sp. 4701]|nr:hypothetical protein [Burkholderia sp. 4701]MXN81500.1 hypothetical protein [Burkholderia sp. 4812]
MSGILFCYEWNTANRPRTRRARHQATFDRRAPARFRPVAEFHNILQTPDDDPTRHDEKRPHAAEAAVRPGVP